MIEILMNNLNRPQIMEDLVLVMIVMLTILSLAIIGIRHIRNYIVDHREGTLKAVAEIKAETEKWRKDPEILRFRDRLLVEIISVFASVIRFATNVASIGGKVHWIITDPDGKKHEENGIITWWGPGVRDTIWFVLLSAIGATILFHYTASLSLEMAWALWIALAWIILWDFPNAGLNKFERLLTYEIPRIFGQLVADIVWSVYYYSVRRALLGLAVFLSFKYILLPIYAPANTLLFENILFFAIVAHFAWYFPYFGPRAIWHRLPTSLWSIQSEEIRGRDVPAKVQFNVSDSKAKIDITNCTAHIRGHGDIWVLRGGWRAYRFEFDTQPGREFSTEIDVRREYATWDPIWCTKMILHVLVEEKDISVREYLPEKRGVRQRTMEHVFALSSRIWNNILGQKKINQG